jgi:hypothetical protein
VNFVLAAQPQLSGDLRQQPAKTGRWVVNRAAHGRPIAGVPCRNKQCAMMATTLDARHDAPAIT